MATQAQKSANRRNARKSTGPRTPQGQARSSLNAAKHAFTASSFIVLRLEDVQEIAHLKADLVACYQPVNAQELFAVERIALAQQTMLRAARLETGLFTSCLNAAIDKYAADPIVPMNENLTNNLEITRAQNRNFGLAHGFHQMAQKANTWSLCLRYQAQAERHYRRAIEELERLKALRGKLPNEPNFSTEPEPNTDTSEQDPVNPITPSAPLPPSLQPLTEPRPHGADVGPQTIPSR